MHLCVRPWSLLTKLNFSKRGPTDTTVFNVSSHSSRRDNEALQILKNYDLQIKIMIPLEVYTVIKIK